MKVTANQIKRVEQDWTRYAKEEVTVEYVKGTFYGFASELACLRLAQVYKGQWEKTEVSFSNNLKKWFFRLETSLA